MSWQPIETAPRDGTDILGAESIRHSKAGYQMGGQVYVCKSIDHDTYDKMWVNSSGFRQPTHWMPLPKAPEEI